MRRPGDRVTRAELERMQDLRAAGLTLRMVAAHLERDATTVCKHLRRANPLAQYLVHRGAGL